MEIWTIVSKRLSVYLLQNTTMFHWVGFDVYCDMRDNVVNNK